MKSEISWSTEVLDEDKDLSYHFFQNQGFSNETVGQFATDCITSFLHLKVD